MDDDVTDADTRNAFDIVDKYDYDDADALFEELHNSSSATIDQNDANELIGKWTTVNDFECTVYVNSIDNLCLEQARKEVPQVLDRVVKRYNVQSIATERRTSQVC